MLYTMLMNKRNFLIGARLSFSLLTFAAIATQLSVHVQHSYSIVNFFSFFTNLSDIYAAIVLLVGAVYLIQYREPTATDAIIRGTSVVCMALVGIVFSVLLRDEDVGTLLPWVNTVLHYIMPVVVVLDWFAEPPKTMLVVKHAVYWLIFPSLYLAYSIIRGAIVGWYAYPFFNPAKSGGYGGVALYCIAIFVMFFLLCWLFMTVRSKAKRTVS